VGPTLRSGASASAYFWPASKSTKQAAWHEPDCTACRSAGVSGTPSSSTTRTSNLWIVAVASAHGASECSVYHQRQAGEPPSCTVFVRNRREARAPRDCRHQQRLQDCRPVTYRWLLTDQRCSRTTMFTTSFNCYTDLEQVCSLVSETLDRCMTRYSNCDLTD
jgi:hypothetical protein